MDWTTLFLNSILCNACSNFSDCLCLMLGVCKSICSDSYAHENPYTGYSVRILIYALTIGRRASACKTVLRQSLKVFLGMGSHFDPPVGLLLSGNSLPG